MIVDPEIPPQDARVLRRSGPVLVRMRQGWDPKLWRPSSGLQYWMLATFGPAATFGVLLSLGIMQPGLAMLLLGLPMVPLLMMLIDRRRRSSDETEDHGFEREAFAQLRWYEGRYVFTGDLDEPAARLLARARQAIATVSGSRVNAEGLLDDVRNAVMLPAQEREIARLLAKLSALRTKHEKVVSAGLTPGAQAVAEPMAQALNSSEAAVLARVEALERYAANVADAERAYLARHQIEELLGEAHAYEELAAETGADTFAVPELEHLAADAAQLEQALRRSVDSAHEALG
ncbi:hypothetical protein E1295_05905 [Nonomuraea mesophila]|uniref:Uncharacterized protein n=2 Tax=Nonomuraea mesophila TaxID=2530382 RepID=A0A4R5FVK3_9ACTN|nr:hypothetical protein E1295_05905 [Nonomuraea mesophila]